MFFQQTSVFILTGQDLSLLSNAIATSGFRISWIGLKCANQQLKGFHSIEELLRFDNAAAQAIEKLSLTANSDQGGEYQIWFSNEDNFKLTFTFNNVGYRFEGDAAQIDLETFTKSLFAETKAWYSFVRSRGFFGGCYVYLVLFLFIITLVYAPAPFFDGKSLPQILPGLWPGLREILVPMLVIVCGFFWFKYAFRLRDRFFPIGTFAVGFGERRHAVLELVRWTIIVGFVVTTIGGLVIIFLQTHFQ
jgi:hypothetical protein